MRARALSGWVFAAAFLPGLYWDRGPETAPALKQAGVERVYVPAAEAPRWSETGIAVTAADLKSFVKLPAPGVQYRMSVASATRVPWIDGNGWQFLRAPGRTYLYEVPAAAAPLAMAEAFAYGVEAVVHPSGELEPFSRMLAFLRRIDRPPLATLANIGVIDDGSEATGEAMNLLARRNLLFRVVAAPDPKLDLNIVPAKEDSANPAEYAQKVRQRLGDDKRLVRLYGSEVVIARLTGDGKTTRLHLLNYSNRKVVGLRVRVRGVYRSSRLTVYGIDQAKVADHENVNGATEFTIPEMGVYAVVDLGGER